MQWWGWRWWRWGRWTAWDKATKVLENIWRLGCSMITSRPETQTKLQQHNHQLAKHRNEGEKDWINSTDSWPGSNQSSLQSHDQLHNLTQSVITRAITMPLPAKNYMMLCENWFYPYQCLRLVMTRCFQMNPGRKVRARYHNIYLSKKRTDVCPICQGFINQQKFVTPCVSTGIVLMSSSRTIRLVVYVVLCSHASKYNLIGTGLITGRPPRILCVRIYDHPEVEHEVLLVQSTVK